MSEPVMVNANEAIELAKESSYSADMNSILPIIILTATACLLIVLELFLKKDKQKLFSFYTSIAGIVAAAFAVIANFQKVPEMFFGQTIKVDPFSSVLTVVILLAGFIVILSMHGFLRRMKLPFGEIYAIILMSLSGMIVMVLSNEMITFYIGLEISAITLYVLTGVNRFNPNSHEAGIKYLILGSFSSAFLLFGISMIYGATGTTVFTDIVPKILENGDKMLAGIMPDRLMLAGLGLMLIGFLFKIGAFPFHMYIPDVYQGAPTPITTMLATASKVSAFAVLIKVIMIVFQGEFKELWINIIITVSIMSMIFGALSGLVQKNFKRLLAYSSIGHTGFILIGVASLGMSTLDKPEDQSSAMMEFNNNQIVAEIDQEIDQASLYLVSSQAENIPAIQENPEAEEETPYSDDPMTAIIFYFVAYTIMTGGAFLGLISAGNDERDVDKLVTLRGYGYRNRFMALIIAVMMFSMAGIPSTAGFIGKYFILKSAINQNLIGLAIVGIIYSIISVYIYLKVVVTLYMKDAEDIQKRHDTNWNYKFGALFTGIATILLGFVPHIILIYINGISILN